MTQTFAVKPTCDCWVVARVYAPGFAIALRFRSLFLDVFRVYDVLLVSLLVGIYVGQQNWTTQMENQKAIFTMPARSAADCSH